MSTLIIKSATYKCKYNTDYGVQVEFNTELPKHLLFLNAAMS